MSFPPPSVQYRSNTSCTPIETCTRLSMLSHASSKAVSKRPMRPSSASRTRSVRQLESRSLFARVLVAVLLAEPTPEVDAEAAGRQQVEVAPLAAAR